MSNSKPYNGYPQQYNSLFGSTLTTTGTVTGTATNWQKSIYTEPTEAEITSRKFQELMPLFDGLLKEAYAEGFKAGLTEGMEQVEKQINEILDVDVIKEAQSQNLDQLPESAV